MGALDPLGKEEKEKKRKKAISKHFTGDLAQGLSE